MTETANRKLKVFLCHATEDKPAVRELYERLNAEFWIAPWLDEEDLLPGQDWDVEIYKATRDADAIIICLSEISVAKEGYVNKEIRRVLEIANEKPEGTIYIIPLRLDDCKPAFLQLKRLHWLDYFAPNADQRLLRSLKIRAEVLKIKTQKRKTGRQEKESPKLSPEAIFREKTPVLQEAYPDLDLYIPPEYSGEYFTPPKSEHPSWTFGEMEFMKIPHGEFIMGSTDDDKDAYDDEKPQHKVNIRYDFLMARFPVTNDLFRKFTKKTSYKTKAEVEGYAWVWNGEKWNKTQGADWAHPQGPKSDVAGKGNHPVVQVFWKDGIAFADWLNKTYRASLPRGLVFRLPTEAEWEKTARGKNGLIYPWGNDFDAENCNWQESVWGGTSPVGVYSPQGDSPFGCADMSGNTWEWTASLWGKKTEKPDCGYPYKPRDGRENQRANDDVLRILRGASFVNPARFLRSAVRFRNNVVVLDDSGFRVALAPRLS